MSPTTATEPQPVSTGSQNLAELLERLGGISPDRIRIPPAPGTATVEDVIAAGECGYCRTCELVDGVLVEKVMGIRESLLTVFLLSRLHDFVTRKNLGLVTGPDGTIQIFPNLVRIPDVAFTSWPRIREGKVPDEAVPLLVPDLAVEVLSRSNTKAEMVRKRREFFEAGVDLVWFVDPRARTVTVYTGPDESKVLTESDTLDGGSVLDGFSIQLKDLFAELDRLAENKTNENK